MAKAGGNTNTTWILLRDARALAIEAYDGAVKKAEDLLTEWLGDGRVRWSCKLFEPAADPAAFNRGADAAGLWFLTGVAYSEDGSMPSGAPASISTGRRTGRTRCT
jgi:hypothetical protein